MILCIKQKVFSWRDRFSVFDDNGNDRYFIEGELMSFAKKLHVYDAQMNEVAFIRQKLWSFMSKYEIYIAGALIGTMSAKFAFKPRYLIEELGWEITGNFWAHDYAIQNTDGGTVAGIHKQWFTWGDCYAVDIADPNDQLPALCAALVIDCVLAAQQSSAAT